MKNAHLPKINILLQFGGEINVSHVWNLGKTGRVCMESSEHKSANISPQNHEKMLRFGKQAFLGMLFLFHFTNLSICDSTTLGLYCNGKYCVFFAGIFNHKQRDSIRGY